MTKKASETLLEIQGKVDRLDKTVTNLDNNIKILLARFNSVSSTKEKPPKEPQAKSEKKTVPFNELPQTSVFEQMKTEAGVVDTPKQTEPQAQSKRRGQRTAPGKRVVVTQEVQTQVGGPVFLANVEILTMNGDLIHQGRTNNKGKWSIPLEPGDYKVNIVKRRKEGVNIQTSYNIQIPSNSKKFDLPPHVLV